MLQYFLECIAFQLVFLIIYDFFLKRETFFQWNRAYLIGTYILSLILPWVKIEAFKTVVLDRFYVYPEYSWGTNDVAIVATAENPGFNIAWDQALFFGGMFMALLFFGYKMLQLYRLRKKGEVHYFKDFTQIVIADSTIAFSFFKSIFLGDKVLKREHKNIIEHELVHIKQKHTWDLLFFELMRIVGWFNPLVYVYQNRVSELHEFIADAQVAKRDKKEHYELLLSQVFQTQNISFINQFFTKSLIKKRIVMLQKAESKKNQRLKYLVMVPILVSMLLYTSCQKETEELTDNKSIDATMVIQDNSLSGKISGLMEDILKKDSLTESERKALVMMIYKTFPNGVKAITGENGNIGSTKNGFAFDTFGRTDLSDAISRYDQLVAERRRLLQSSNETNPVIINLDQQIAGLLNQNESLKNAAGDIELKKIEERRNSAMSMRYNQLVLERARLLLNSDERNPVIVNLDQQIKGLKDQLEKQKK